MRTQGLPNLPKVTALKWQSPKSVRPESTPLTTGSSQKQVLQGKKTLPLGKPAALSRWPTCTQIIRISPASTGPPDMGLGPRLLGLECSSPELDPQQRMSLSQGGTWWGGWSPRPTGRTKPGRPPDGKAGGWGGWRLVCTRLELTCS